MKKLLLGISIALILAFTLSLVPMMVSAVDFDLGPFNYGESNNPLHKGWATAGRANIGESKLSVETLKQAKQLVIELSDPLPLYHDDIYFVFQSNVNEWDDKLTVKVTGTSFTVDLEAIDSWADFVAEGTYAGFMIGDGWWQEDWWATMSVVSAKLTGINNIVEPEADAGITAGEAVDRDTAETPAVDDAVEINIDLPSVIEPVPMPTAPVLSDYACVAGEITKVEEHVAQDAETPKTLIHYTIKSGEAEYIAVVSDKTYSIFFGKTDRKAPGVGDSIRVFYDAKSIMLMIYPMYINADFIAVNLDEANSVAIARFDEDFVSAQYSLKLNISEDTEIVLEDGTEFEGEAKDLIGRKLVVIYSVTTRSIPAITVPEKIIVMFEKIVAPIYILTDEEKAAFAESFENSEIVINGKAIESPKAFMTDDLILMVPVRPVAEALGLAVEWFEDTESVQVGINLFFSIDKDEYSFARMAPVSLGAAPVLVNDRTYVPIELFTKWLDVDWYFEDGQIKIKMIVEEEEAGEIETAEELEEDAKAEENDEDESEDDEDEEDEDNEDSEE